MKKIKVVLAMMGVVLLVAAPAAKADGWEFSLTPYLWANGLDGTVGLGAGDDGEIVVDFDTSFSDILDNLDMAVPIHFEAKAPVWTLIAEVNYVSLSQELGNVGGEGEIDVLVAELLAGWQWTETVEILFGSRYYSYDVGLTLDVPPPSFPDGTVDGDTYWVDPVVGIRYGGQLNRRGTWTSQFRADVGGFGLGSDLTWNVRVGLGYDFSETVGLRFGYHWLDVDYNDNKFLFDVLQQGPEIGLSFMW